MFIECRLMKNITDTILRFFMNVVYWFINSIMFNVSNQA